MTELRTKQARFVRLVAKLIDYAYANGYELAFGEAWRTAEQAAWNAQKKGTGIVNSLHCDRLAIDLNLFRNGTYLDGSEHHRPLGKYWETLAEDCAWGGRFKPKPDGNHYSLTYDGRK